MKYLLRIWYLKTMFKNVVVDLKAATWWAGYEFRKLQGALKMTDKCKIVGPYLPIGDTDYECRTHEVLAELRDPSRFGQAGIRKDEMYCPIGEPDGRT